MLHNVHRNATRRRGVHELHDDDRLDDPRGRHHPLAARRGDHGRSRSSRRSGRRSRSRTSRTPSSRSSRPESGILSTVEFFANCQYGYDVRCELVGSTGIATMTNPTVASTIAGGRVAARSPPTGASGSAPRTRPSSRPGSAASQRGETVGASAWEGYAATKVVEVGRRGGEDRRADGHRLHREARPVPLTDGPARSVATSPRRSR